MILIAGYLGAVLMGLSLGLIGGGGSILTVPILVFLFGYNPAMATTYSLFVVGSTSSVGAISHLQLGNINKRAVLLFGLPSVISVFITRKWLVPLIPDHLFSIGSFEITHAIAQLVIFGVLMLFAAITIIKDKKKAECVECTARYQPVIIKGLFIGVITGLLGAGGGFLIIPALVLLLGLDMKKAVGTSLMIITMNSLIGFAGSLSIENPDWKFLISFSLVAIAGILFGSFLSKKISSEKLKPVFGWFVLLMGSYIIIKELFIR
ncbi:MAG: sulfite exporter TauE/SafE family protein [Bacteroidota bacterium]